ncbi:MAG: branched-chain amino acid ABC transporter permease [Actinomycetota bacterium]|nr:branched-chain amino acid ABC transporter permease [Actinomycetota bacterium]
MSDLTQLLAIGVTLGAIYAMVGVGFVIINNVTGIINFAQGEYLMVGAMTATTLVAAGWPLLAAFSAATLLSALLGGLLERVTIRLAHGASVETLILITIGTSITMSGVALLVWGVNPRRYGAFTEGPPVRVAGAAISRQSLWVLAFTALVAGGLWWFFERTTSGKAMRACAMNPEAARLQGISPSRRSPASFVLSTGIAGAAGVVLVPITSASYDMGLPLALKGFTAAVIGGLVSPLGAIAGGFLLGVAESLASGYVASGLKDGIAFAVLFAVLVLRPQGLLGRRLVSRV